MKFKIEIEIRGDSNHVSEADLYVHLQEISKDITGYAERVLSEDYYRKFQVDYETQEPVDLYITHTTDEVK